MKRQNYNFKKGIALFYALIIISLVMAVSLTVFSLISGGLPLAEIIKNSQKAFFSADAGVECVLYWDIKHPEFDDSAFENSNSINCLGSVVSLTSVSSDSHFSDSHFDFTLNLDKGTCVDISVFKPSFGPTKTEIKSSGHSPCASGSKNRTERTLEVIY